MPVNPLYNKKSLNEQAGAYGGSVGSPVKNPILKQQRCRRKAAAHGQKVFFAYVILEPQSALLRSGTATLDSIFAGEASLLLHLIILAPRKFA